MVYELFAVGNGGKPNETGIAVVSPPQPRRLPVREKPTWHVGLQNFEVDTSRIFGTGRVHDGKVEAFEVVLLPLELLRIFRLAATLTSSSGQPVFSQPRKSS